MTRSDWVSPGSRKLVVFLDFSHLVPIGYKTSNYNILGTGGAASAATEASFQLGFSIQFPNHCSKQFSLLKP